jgi:hypothetical protein
LLKNDSYAEKKQFLMNERMARTKNALVVTGNPKDCLSSKDIKQILGSGYTLKLVAECFNLSPEHNKRSRYITGIRRV